MSKNDIKNKIRENIYFKKGDLSLVKSKKENTGDFKKDVEWLVQYEKYSNEGWLINLKEYLQKNMPDIYEEMSQNPLYSPWIGGYSGNRTVMGITHMEYDDKIVGFITYMHTKLMGAKKQSLIKGGILIETIYLLEEFRGKGLVADCLRRMLPVTADNKLQLMISKPNYNLICSLKKHNLLLETPNAPHILFSPLMAFECGNDGSKIVDMVTPFYDTNLKTIVQLVGDDVFRGDILDTDVVLNGAINSTLEYTPDSYGEQLYYSLKYAMDFWKTAFIELGKTQGLSFFEG